MQIKIQSITLSATILSSVVLSAPLAVGTQRVISGNDSYLSTEQMDADRSQTLSIKKLPHNPNNDPIPGAKPYGGIENLTFRLSKVYEADVSTEAGREAAKQYTIEYARIKGFSDTWEQNTDENGEAQFRDLSSGLYLVAEFATDAEHDWQLSSPRLSILPLGDVLGDAYSYDNVLVTKPDQGITPHMPETPGNPGNTGNTGRMNTRDDKINSSEDEQVRNGDKGTLAVTGANVIWAFVAGMALIMVGSVLIRRNSEDK